MDVRTARPVRFGAGINQGGIVVRMKGLEPSLPRGNRNLNPARLPISPHPHVYDVFEFTTLSETAAGAKTVAANLGAKA